jgi:peptidoglycan/LPS O-acetylase OafA/YrhL
VAGLDGLRALAVVAVLLYHSGFVAAGFLGVEVFFVISGYLITLLLLEEWHTHGHIDLPAFWLRRARRLLPASFAVIVTTLAFAALVLPDEVAALRGAALAGLVSVSNWYAIVAQQSYFESVGRPSLLRHLWSLSIEAQFYLVWPPILLLGLRHWRRRTLVIAVLALAAGSAGLMAVLYQPDADPSRVYYGTDTRASGLLLGSVLALVLRRGRLVPPANPRVVDTLGFGGLAALAYLCARLGEFDPLLYHGGFAAVGLLTAVVIAVAVQPDSHLGNRLLAWQPLVWIGVRSYGIYLWHWPVFMLTRPRLDVGFDGWPLLVVRLLVVAVLADLSFRCVEMPIRGGALARLARLRSVALSRWAAAAAGGLVCLVLLGTSVAAAKPPERPAYLPVDAVDTWNAPAPATVLENASPPSVAAVPTLVTAEEVPPSTLLSAAAVGAAPTLRVTAIGDSVMLGAVTALQNAIDSIEIDAALNRQPSAAIDILQSRAAAGQLGDVVVIHIGNNGTVTARQFDEMMDALVDVPRVVFLSVKVPRTWERPNDAVLANGVQRYPNAVLVDWRAASSDHPELFWEDGIHLRPEGASAYAALLAAHIGF